MENIHSLLKRQLKKYLRESFSDPEELQAIFAAINNAYIQSDIDRNMLERSLDLSSQELLIANAELKKTLSLLNATIESTRDGILVVDLTGEMNSFNKNFVDMWHIPSYIVDSRDDSAALSFVLEQLQDPDGFIKRVRELYVQPDAESYDLLQFKDGRIFERYSRPQRIEDKCVGRVWSFRDITTRKRAEEGLLIKSQAIESSINAIAFLDLDAKLTYVNDSFLRLWGYTDQTEVIGRSALDLWHQKEDALKVIELLLQNGQGSWFGELTAKRKDGSLFDVQLSTNLVRDEKGTPICLLGSFINITKRKLAEQALKTKDIDLEIKTKNLEEINTALNVLLKKREEDKTELEEKVLSNIKQLVEPYISKLKQSGLNEMQKALIAILESNLKDVTSSFAYSLSSRHLNLTPSEVKIANLITQDKTSKEICDILGSSQKMVAFHRQNIRRKLDLQNKKVNLKSYLLAKALK